MTEPLDSTPDLLRAGHQWRQIQLVCEHLRAVPWPWPPHDFVALAAAFRDLSRLAAAAAHALDPPSEERDEVRLTRLLKESAAAARKRAAAQERTP